MPQRICVACRETHPKRELVRVVRTPEGSVAVDETGKRSGRGAYLCRRRACWEKALSHGHLARALKVTLTAEAEAQLRDFVAGLPQNPETTEPEGHEAAEKGGRGDE